MRRAINIRQMCRFGGVAAIALALAACDASHSANRATRPTTVTPPPRIAGVQAPSTPVAPLRVGPIRIALLAPLSGEFQDAGRDLSNGAAMGLLEAPSGSAEILAFDTAGDIAKTTAALKAAIAAEADIVIGPLFGKNAAGVAPKLQAANLTALSFSNDGSVASSHVLIMGHAVQVETARIVQHAAANGAATIAVFGKADATGEAALSQANREDAAEPGLFIRPALYDAGTSYTDIARNVQDVLNARGRQAERTETAGRLKAQLSASPNPGGELQRLAVTRPPQERPLFQSLAEQFQGLIAAGAVRESAINAVVARYAAEGPLGGGAVNAVLLTIRGGELSTVAPMFQLYDAEASGVRLLGLSGWLDMDPARARELHNGRFAAPPASEAFDNRYEASFGKFPSELAAVAYDTVKLALAASAAPTARPIPPAAIKAQGEVIGAAGPVRMSAAGLALRPLEVLEMRPTGVFPIDPARIVEPAHPSNAVGTPALITAPRPAGS